MGSPTDMLPSSDHAWTIGGICSLLLFALYKISQYYRSDVLKINEDHKAEVQQMVKDNRDERKEADAKHEAAIAKRDELCSANTEAVKALTNSVNNRLVLIESKVGIQTDATKH